MQWQVAGPGTVCAPRHDASHGSLLHPVECGAYMFKRAICLSWSWSFRGRDRKREMNHLLLHASDATMVSDGPDQSQTNTHMDVSIRGGSLTCCATVLAWDVLINYRMM